MVAACEFRHYAAVGSMHIDLSVDGVGQQPFFAVDQRNASFITRAFNAENFHKSKELKRKSVAILARAIHFRSFM